jgi:endonuclease/exonuclease/phosphatase family metal-dependent hydrolase
MRRAVIVLVGLLGLVSGALVGAPSAEALSAPGGVTASAGRAFDAVIVGWTWSTTPAAYVVQISESRKFTDATQVKVPGRSSKPSGGRQTYRFTGLQDGTKFFVRVAAASSNGKLSGWSGARTAKTRMRLPSAPTGPVKAVAGPGPGQVTFTWSTHGDYTDKFVIETATSPFDPKPRDHAVFSIDPHLRTYTLSAAQTQQAHAGVGTGWTLVWRFRAVNTGTAGGSEQRYFGQGQSRVMGEAAAGSGSALRVASYNIRTDNITSPDALTWDSRVPRIASLIKDRRPGIVLLQELFPSMVSKFVGTLASKGMDNYALNRQTALVTGVLGEQKLQSRILYDKTKYEMVDRCSVVVTSTDCSISWPSDAGPDYSPFVRMRDKASGQEFYVLGWHLPRGEGLDAVRTAAMRSIMDQVDALNTDHLPVIVGGDTNSSQLRAGERPHDVLMEHGFYDTASTVDQVNPEYGTANDFAYQDPSPFGVSPRIDVIATLGMPGSDRFVNEVVKKGDPFPSDHNMIWTDLRLP